MYRHSKLYAGLRIVSTADFRAQGYPVIVTLALETTKKFKYNLAVSFGDISPVSVCDKSEVG